MRIIVDCPVVQDTGMQLEYGFEVSVDGGQTWERGAYGVGPRGGTGPTPRPNSYTCFPLVTSTYLIRPYVRTFIDGVVIGFKTEQTRTSTVLGL